MEKIQHLGYLTLDDKLEMIFICAASEWKKEEELVTKRNSLKVDIL